MTEPDLLESVRGATARWKAGGATRVLEFFPADAAAMSRIEEAVGHVPQGIAKLLAFASGFRVRESSVEFEVTFDGTEAGLEDAFPRCVSLMQDVCGNDWRVDVNPVSGEWGRVYYVCHDPAVIVVQAEGLVEFVEQLLSVPVNGQPDPLVSVKEEASARIWRERPNAVPASAGAGLAPGSFVADLRQARKGEGFAWGMLGPFVRIWRPSPDPVWNLEPPLRKGCLAWFLGR